MKNDLPDEMLLQTPRMKTFFNLSRFADEDRPTPTSTTAHSMRDRLRGLGC